MDDYDRIQNCSGIKYGPYEIFDNFKINIFYGGQTYRIENDYNKEQAPFCPMWYT